MPPKQTTTAARRGRPPSKTSGAIGSKSGARGTGGKATGEAERARQLDQDAGPATDDGDTDEEGSPISIPPDLLTRILHEFFETDGTRISREANSAVARYMDIFVREAIARAAREREGGFLEVEDLEKVAPQLLLDL